MCISVRKCSLSVLLETGRKYVFGLVLFNVGESKHLVQSSHTNCNEICISLTLRN